MIDRVGFLPHFAAFFALRPHGRECPFFQPSMTKSSLSSRARVGGDVESQTPRCSATLIKCIYCGVWKNTCHKSRVRTTTKTTTTTTKTTTTTTTSVAIFAQEQSRSKRAVKQFSLSVSVGLRLLMSCGNGLGDGLPPSACRPVWLFSRTFLVLASLVGYFGCVLSFQGSLLAEVQRRRCSLASSTMSSSSVWGWCPCPR